VSINKLGALELGEVELPIQARRGTAERMSKAKELAAVGAGEGPDRIGHGWQAREFKRKVSVERYPEAIASAVMGNLEAREQHRNSRLPLGTVQQRKNLVFDLGPSRNRVFAVEPPGSAPNRPLQATVRYAARA